jgi:hypothetical protein
LVLFTFSLGVSSKATAQTFYPLQIGDDVGTVQNSAVDATDAGTTATLRLYTADGLAHADITVTISGDLVLDGTTWAPGTYVLKAGDTMTGTLTVPDIRLTNTIQTTGGNARGTGAVDLQASRATASQVASGELSGVLWGRNNTASGARSVAGGDTAQATAADAIALGDGARATAANATGLGGGWALGVNSVSFGAAGYADGQDAVSIGGQSGSWAGGRAATQVGGRNVWALGDYSISAGGNSNKVNADGYEGVIFGGHNNTINHEFSAIIGGYFNTINAPESVIVAGLEAETHDFGEVLMGAYPTVGTGSETERTASNRVFGVGNGEEGSPSMAWELFYDGDSEFAGDLTANNLSGTNTGDQDLIATVEADDGSFSVSTPTDTLVIAGGDDIATTITGNVVTINYTGSGGGGGGLSDAYSTVTGDSGTASASGASTLDFEGAGIVSVAVSSGTPDKVTITATEVDGDASNELQTLSLLGTDVTLSDGGGTVSIEDGDADDTNEIQNIIAEVDADTGTFAASTSADVLTIAGGTDISTSISGGALTIDYTGSGGTGDVVGPASSTDNVLARFDGTTGKLLQNGQTTEDDSGNVCVAGDLCVGDVFTASSQPTAYVYNDASQAIATATVTALTFDSEYEDPDGMHSTTTNTDRITVAVTGLYDIAGNITWAANATGIRMAWISPNGDTSNRVSLWRLNADGGLNSFPLSGKIRLTAGDYIQIYVYQDSGGGLFCGSSSVEYENKIRLTLLN